MALIKIGHDGGSFGDVVNYINTSKASQIIFGILLSVVVAFTIGALVQWVSRVLLSYDFENKAKWVGAIFGGIALTAITYFIFMKGIKGTAYAGESFDIYEWEDGAGTPIGSDYFVEVGGGTYCVTVTDSAAGCTGSTCTTILPNTSPTVEVTAFVEICREDVGLAPGVILDFNAQVVGGTSGTWVNIDNIGDLDFLSDLDSVNFSCPDVS